MCGSSAEKSPFDRLLDAGVYAPLGFLLTRNKAGAGLAEAGRKQVAFTRSLGRAALQGLVRARSESTDAGVIGSRPADIGPTGNIPTESVSERTDQPVAAAKAPVPIEGYEAMTAREVVALLASCEQPQVRWILDREKAGKNRVTITRAATKALG